MINRKIAYCCFLLAFLFSSCEKAFIKSGESKDPVENFDALFQSLNEHYTYFEYKNLDPQMLYTKYRSKITSSTTDKQLFELMTEMLDKLKDGHISLVAPQGSYFYNITRSYPSNFDFKIIEENYLLSGQATSYNRNGAFVYNVLDNNIGYVHYNSFDSDMVHIDKILQEFNDRKVTALILDVRNNNGGQMANVIKLAGRFTDQKRKVGHSIFKTGPGKNAYSDSLSVYVAPEGLFWNKPVMVLTNRGCFSACSYFVEIVKHFPNIEVIGAATGGGGGMPVEYELPNGWAYKVPVTAFFGITGFNIENGVPPDVMAETNAESAKMGKDDIIERAKALLK